MTGQPKTLQFNNPGIKNYDNIMILTFNISDLLSESKLLFYIWN